MNLKWQWIKGSAAVTTRMAVLALAVYSLQPIARQSPTTSPTPPVMTSPPGAAAVEQRSQGTLPGAALVDSFDGLGLGFQGPQGTAALRNPSDNTLAVGPNHIFQIVN